MSAERPKEVAGLRTKNTFLDCQSPWIDYVSERPKSDPTSYRKTTSSTSSTSNPSSSSREGILQRRRLVGVENTSQQEQELPWSLPEQEVEETEEDGRAESSEDRLTRTQRRRLQRNSVKQYRIRRAARDAETEKDGEAYLSGASLDARPSGGHAAASSTNATRIGATRLSL